MNDYKQLIVLYKKKKFKKCLKALHALWEQVENPAPANNHYISQYLKMKRTKAVEVEGVLPHLLTAGLIMEVDWPSNEVSCLKLRVAAMAAAHYQTGLGPGRPPLAPAEQAVEL